MTEATSGEVDTSPNTAEPGAASVAASAPPRRGLSALQIAVLVAACAFLGSTIGFVVGQRSNDDPLSTVDVGFMQDMGEHHTQAVQMSLLLLDKPEVDGGLKSFATEIIIGQRYEQGVFASTLSRFGHASEPGDTVMGWMGEPYPVDEMPGLATEAQMAELADAEGDDAAALWIALMCEHHLAGLHMADYEARHGSDSTTVKLAKAMVKTQRSEVIDIQRYRTTHDLPIPDGFTDPLDDQRLNPISFTDPEGD